LWRFSNFRLRAHDVDLGTLPSALHVGASVPAVVASFCFSNVLFLLTLWVQAVVTLTGVRVLSTLCAIGVSPSLRVSAPCARAAASVSLSRDDKVT
jgi:hypothetical protein